MGFWLLPILPSLPGQTPYVPSGDLSVALTELWGPSVSRLKTLDTGLAPAGPLLSTVTGDLSAKGHVHRPPWLPLEPQLPGMN